jgi:hypothetical protein
MLHGFDNSTSLTVRSPLAQDLNALLFVQMVLLKTRKLVWMYICKGNQTKKKVVGNVNYFRLGHIRKYNFLLCVAGILLELVLG